MNADQVADLLDALGKTPQAIADALEAQKIRGVPDDCTACPLAVYLISSGARVRVNLDTVRLLDECGDEEDGFGLTKEQREFVRMFDGGEFPALVSP